MTLIADWKAGMPCWRLGSDSQESVIFPLTLAVIDSKYEPLNGELPSTSLLRPSVGRL